MEQQRWTPDVRDWKLDLGRGVAGGLGSIVALALAGWPTGPAEAAWVALGGAVVGLALFLAGEWVLQLQREVRRLHGVDRELEAERRSFDEERKWRDYHLAVARAEAAVSAVDVRVFGGAHTEALKTGRVLPLAVILARREALLQAENLDKPVPRPN